MVYALCAPALQMLCDYIKKDMNAMKITSENYISELKKHNESALSYIIDEYGGLVKSIVRKYLYALPQYQEECMSDIFFQVWNNIRYFDGMKNSFRNWLAGVARFRSIDYLRRYRRELEMENIDHITVAAKEDMYQQLVENEISEELQNMLSCLNPRDQELFRRLYIEEQDIGQVSREMNMKESAVYNRVSRGKRKIRNLYPRENKER